MQKFLNRAKKTGKTGKALLADARARYADFKSQQPGRAKAPKKRGPASETIILRPRKRQATGQDRALMPFVQRMPQIPTIMMNPKYHDFFIKHYHNSLPVPYATAPSGVGGNRTLPVRGTVSQAFMVPAGTFFALAPTPSDVSNAPFRYFNTSGTNADLAGVTLTKGSWFGGIGPQQLFGEVPNSGAVDSRAVQFKGGHLELTVAVGYNSAVDLTYLDPYTTLRYGQATGLEQILLPQTISPTGPKMASRQDRPVFSMQQWPNGGDLKNIGVTKPLIGSSGSSSGTCRQVIRPLSHSYDVSAELADPNSANELGFPISEGPGSGLSISMFSQGVYIVDNRLGTTPVSVALLMDMAYRVRVDNQSPAVFNMAEQRTVPPVPIEFIPAIAHGPSVATAAVAQAKLHNLTGQQKVLASPTPAPSGVASQALVSRQQTQNPEQLSGKELAKKIPIVRGGVEAFSGLERAFTKGDDPAELFGGLGQFALGTLGAMGDLFSIFG